MGYSDVLWDIKHILNNNNTLLEEQNDSLSALLKEQNALLKEISAKLDRISVATPSKDTQVKTKSNSDGGRV